MSQPIKKAHRSGFPSEKLSANWRTQHFSKQKLAHVARVLAPTLLALTFAGVANVAHAQGTMDFSGAQTLMGSFKTFAIYAGAVICFGGLIFAGIRMMSGRFQDAIPGLFGALFGAGVLGWAMRLRREEAAHPRSRATRRSTPEHHTGADWKIRSPSLLHHARSFVAQDERLFPGCENRR